MNVQGRKPHIRSAACLWATLSEQQWRQGWVMNVMAA